MPVPEDSQGGETTVSDTIMVDTCRYESVQTQRMHSAESEPWASGDDDVSMEVHRF